MDCPEDIKEAALAAKAAGTHDVETENLEWWQEATVYQVLIPSFKDSNGDGKGDIGGVVDNLDYLVDLGVDIVWLTPIFESPMFDMGYDIRHYTEINPVYGTLEDVDHLVKTAHEKGLKVIIDIALNHTSVEHEWFQTSRANRRDPNGNKRDWYIWQPGTVDAEGNRHPPNNWESAFGGSAWTYDEVAGEYYMHIFGEKQADINWENEEVRQEIYKVLRWWLDRGLDGFRLDCMNLISKAHGFPDAPTIKPGEPLQQANCCFANGPNVHKHLQDLNEHVFSKYDIVTIGEMSCGISSDQAVEYLSKYKPRRELHLLIQFQHVELDCHDGDKWLLREWELPELKRIMDDWQRKMMHCGGWMTLWMENHDQPRGISRFTTSTPRFRGFCAKMLAMWLFTLRGTPLLFQGQELGMINPECFSEEMNQDIETILFWNSAKDQDPQKVEHAKKAILQKGRDNTRVPMPWTGEPNGGFCSDVKPWMPPCPDGKEWSIENQQKDVTSVLSFYRKMIQMRKSHPTLLYGSIEILDLDNLHTFAYLRRFKGTRYLTVLNFSPGAVTWTAADKGLALEDAQLLLSNYDKQSENVCDPLVLRPYEGVIYELTG
ncbi:hypothetical protein VTN77DRAFT_7318 [Rasamsonia byssochlamydoides]|uniref:uncharacterized protein n=1 Tax=Rasamsonia byssochlamydoides TaxID=89139 RepID=UPI0037423938